MKLYYDPASKFSIKGYISLDTNVLAFCARDPQFFQEFITITENTDIVIDPIVRLEFLRGAYQEHTYNEKKQFIEYERFHIMEDHYLTYQQIYEKALFIGRILSHYGKPEMKLGDILILSRLASYQQKILFATFDKDFSCNLMDRSAVITVEIVTKQGMFSELETMQVLSFNHEEFLKFKNKLPQ